MQTTYDMSLIRQQLTTLQPYVLPPMEEEFYDQQEADAKTRADGLLRAWLPHRFPPAPAPSPMHDTEMETAGSDHTLDLDGGQGGEDGSEHTQEVEGGSEYDIPGEDD